MHSRTRSSNSKAVVLTAADSGPRVEFLWWEGCPSWERALAVLGDVMAECGIDPATIELREIVTEGDVARERFYGSPTIRIDGEDIQPQAGAEPAGLSCRVYRRPDGRISPLPDREDIRDAFLDAVPDSGSKTAVGSPIAAAGKRNSSAKDRRA